MPGIPSLTFSPTKINRDGDGGSNGFGSIYNGTSTPKESRNKMLLFAFVVIIIAWLAVLKGLK